MEPPFAKSIIRDVFKQSLVDALEPNYQAQERLIIDRIQQIFPNFNLTFLLDEFSLGSCKPNATLVPSNTSFMKQVQTSPLSRYFVSYVASRKKSEKTRLMAGLSHAVKNKLGLSLEVFAEKIRDDESFKVLLEKVGSHEKNEN